MKNICVYRHRRFDTNEIFYVGIGERNYRPYRKTHRSKYWKRIILKTEYDVEILAENLSWEDACELEILLISEYGRKDLKTGCLINFTNGGEGSLGRKMLTTTKEKISIANKGNQYRLGIKNTEQSKIKQSISVGFKVIHIETNEIFNSIKEVSEKFKITHTVLARFLRGCKTKKDYPFKLLKN